MGIYYFDKQAYIGNQIILDIAEALDEPNNLRKAERVLKAVMHTLRDIMTIEVSFQLMWQLPLFLKGMYASEWKYRSAPLKLEYLDEFVEAVKIKDNTTGNQDFVSTEDLLYAIKNVFKVLKNYLAASEWQVILDHLPDELQARLPSVFTTH